jgi:hypothetical protein
MTGWVECRNCESRWHEHSEKSEATTVQDGKEYVWEVYSETDATGTLYATREKAEEATLDILRSYLKKGHEYGSVEIHVPEKREVK